MSSLYNEHMRVFDAFLFFNELELLQIRFEELWDVVDYFVICEATKTFQNKSKPLYYLDNADKFARFSKKIVHHIYDPKISSHHSIPAYRQNVAGQRFPANWYIEREQRRQIKTPLLPLVNDDDIVLLSDADEIMSRDNVHYIRMNPELFKDLIVASMQMSYGYIDTVIDEPMGHKHWLGTGILTGASLKSSDLQEVRDKCQYAPVLQEAGWHLSYLGGAEQIRAKLESFSHAEWNREPYTDLTRIADRINHLQDPLDRPGFVIRRETDKSKFPRSSLQFPHLFYQDK